MKQIHMKQKLIASAVAGALMIPGSAMTVHAADNETKVNAASKIVGIESILKDYQSSNVKDGLHLYSVFASIGDYLKMAPSGEENISSEDVKQDKTKEDNKLAAQESEQDTNNEKIIKANETKAEVAEPEEDTITVATVTADVLNVRAGQGTEFQILLQILEQEQYEITGTAVNGWYPITVNQIDGWVCGDWITVEEMDKAEFMAEEPIEQDNVQSQEETAVQNG